MGVTLKVVVDQTTTYEKQGGGGGDIKLHDITAVFNLKYISVISNSKKENKSSTLQSTTVQVHK